MKFIDSHIHTHYSHGEAEVFEMTTRALDMGLDNLGFAEHLLRVSNENLPIGQDIIFNSERDFELYYNTAKRCKNYYKDSLEIRIGAECDFIENEEQLLKDALSNYKDLDFLMGSIHFIGKPSMYCREHEYLNSQQIQDEYIMQTKKLIKSDIFDILSHPELIRYDIPTFKNDVREIVKLLKKHNMAAEINTSYIDVTTSETLKGSLNPSLEFIECCYKEDVPLVLGSDAHQADNIANNFEAAINFLKSSGIKKLAYYKERKPIFYEL